MPDARPGSGRLESLWRSRPVGAARRSGLPAGPHRVGRHTALVGTREGLAGPLALGPALPLALSLALPLTLLHALALALALALPLLHPLALSLALALHPLALALPLAALAALALHALALPLSLALHALTLALAALALAFSRTRLARLAVRPLASALALGPPALALEALALADGTSLVEAAGTPRATETGTRSAGTGTDDARAGAEARTARIGAEGVQPVPALAPQHFEAALAAQLGADQQPLHHAAHHRSGRDVAGVAVLGEARAGCGEHGRDCGGRHDDALQAKIPRYATMDGNVLIDEAQSGFPLLHGG